MPPRTPFLQAGPRGNSIDGGRGRGRCWRLLPLARARELSCSFPKSGTRMQPPGHAHAHLLVARRLPLMPALSWGPPRWATSTTRAGGRGGGPLASGPHGACSGAPLTQLRLPARAETPPPLGVWAPPGAPAHVSASGGRRRRLHAGADGAKRERGLLLAFKHLHMCLCAPKPASFTHLALLLGTTQYYPPPPHCYWRGGWPHGCPPVCAEWSGADIPHCSACVACSRSTVAQPRSSCSNFGQPNSAMNAAASLALRLPPPTWWWSGR
jgi:hypothetical protein